MREIRSRINAAVCYILIFRTFHLMPCKRQQIKWALITAILSITGQSFPKHGSLHITIQALLGVTNSQA